MYKVLVEKPEWKECWQEQGTNGCIILNEVRKGVESDLAQDVGLVKSTINFQVSQNTGNIFAS
jgi:hypothetical protein